MTARPLPEPTADLADVRIALAILGDPAHDAWDGRAWLAAARRGMLGHAFALALGAALDLGRDVPPSRPPFGVMRAEGVLEELGLRPLYAAVYAALVERRRPLREGDRTPVGVDAALRGDAIDRVMHLVGGIEHAARWRTTAAPLSADAHRWLRARYQKELTP
jgi:hypothetical protein